MVGSSKKVAERTAVIAIAMAVLLIQPMLSVFDVGPRWTVLGIPVLFFYVFSVWSLAVLVLAFVMERSGIPTEEDDGAKQPDLDRE
jgi:hypothetical protein